MRIICARSVHGANRFLRNEANFFLNYQASLPLVLLKGPRVAVDQYRRSPKRARKIQKGAAKEAQEKEECYDRIHDTGNE
jgi:hypothetical protein